jgi:serine/threonine protein kinase
LFVESNLFAIDIVQMIGTYKEDGKQYLVLEYIPKGDVLSLLVKHGEKLKFADQLDLIIGAARGMEYLEQEKVIHNDLGLFCYPLVNSNQSTIISCQKFTGVQKG